MITRSEWMQALRVVVMLLAALSLCWGLIHTMSFPGPGASVVSQRVLRPMRIWIGSRPRYEKAQLEGARRSPNEPWRLSAEGFPADPQATESFLSSARIITRFDGFWAATEQVEEHSLLVVGPKAWRDPHTGPYTEWTFDPGSEAALFRAELIDAYRARGVLLDPALATHGSVIVRTPRPAGAWENAWVLASLGALVLAAAPTSRRRKAPMGSPSARDPFNDVGA